MRRSKFLTRYNYSLTIFTNDMKSTKFKLILGIGVMSVLWWGRTPAASSGDTSAGPLTAGQIFETTRENYASLSTYSDQGRIITIMDSSVTGTDFATRLGRQGFYRIEWDHFSEPPDPGLNTNLEGAWFCGTGDYAQRAWGMRRQYDRDIAFANLATSPAGSVTAVPRIFFGMQGSGAADTMIGLERLADDKIGNLECYQLTGQSASGEIKTLWIGKQDFFIHQIRTEASTNVLQAAWAGTTVGKLNPSANYHGYISIETYTNIVADRPYLPSDFAPTFSLFEQRNF
jgi:hypothetical protein